MGLEILRLTLNKDTKSPVRKETMEDREYLVVPMVMLTEGVHTGSGGPLLYSEKNLSDRPVVWNHKPIVVYHPEIDGQPVSACDPVIINNRKVGLIMNTQWDSAAKKLRAEAWFEEHRLKKVDKRILNAINKNEIVELSTGLYTDNDETPGEWNGEKYDAVAGNFKPDHLAILFDQIGACSVKKGAGLLQINAAVSQDHLPDLEKYLGLIGVSPQPMEYMGLTANAVSFSQIREALIPLLRDKYGKPGVEWWGWIEEVYPGFCIYYSAGKLYKIKYNTSGDVVSLVGDTEEVFRIVEYRAADSSLVGNTSGRNPDPKETEMAKKDIIDRLIQNGGWKEEQRAYLDTQAEDVLKAFPVVQAPVLNTTPPANTAAAGAMSVDQYIATLPPAVQETIKSGLTVHAQMKDGCVKAIMANKANKLTQAWLESRSLEELQGISMLANASAAPPEIDPTKQGGGGNIPVLQANALYTPHFFGAQGGAGPVVNAGNGQGADPDAEAPLARPGYVQKVTGTQDKAGAAK